MDPKPDPARVLDRVPQIGSQREDQQDERAEREQVPVALKVARATHNSKGDDVGGDSESRPDCLVVPRRPGIGEAEDHHETDAVQHQDDGHHDGIGLWGEETIGEVHDERQGRDRADEFQCVSR